MNNFAKTKQSLVWIFYKYSYTWIIHYTLLIIHLFMICYLKGKILDLQNTKLEVLTQWGIGYEVGISEINYAEIVDKKLQEIELFIYHHITDNSQALYGFLKKEEKEIFEELIKISGVWGKVALAILSLGINVLLQAIASGDKKTIESVKGIGKKMAEKIILELKDKDFVDRQIIEQKLEDNQVKQAKVEKSILQDVKSSLVNMGYNPKDISRVLEELPEDMKDIGEILPWVIGKLW